MLGAVSVFIAFLEEHYFREKEYEAFIISLIGGIACLNLSLSAEKLVSAHEWTLTSDQLNELSAHDSR